MPRPYADHMVSEHCDVLVIGSGFGGAVSALRLTEKGYRVTVLEAGRRFADRDHATTSWALRDFVWAPRLGLTGVQRVHVLPDIVVLAGAGVGGGSLNYANTLYEPKSPAFYRDRQWGHITDWKAELAPYYAQAKRMLGVVTQPSTTPADLVMQKVAERMGVADTYGPTQVGVFYGRDGDKEPGVTVPDPFFGGAGPARTGCRECGECMTGCRHGAKNTLVKNYLHLAESAGARIVPERTVTEVRERDGRRLRGHDGPQHRLGAHAHRPHVHGRPGGGVGRHLGHPAAAPPDEGRRPARPAVGPPRPPHPHQQREPRRRGRAAQQPRAARLHPRRRDHQLDPPGRHHPHRAVPLREGQQRDGPAVDARDDAPSGTEALGHLARRARQAPRDARRAVPRHQPLVRARDHHPGHADLGQQPDAADEEGPARPDPGDERAGPRRAEPDLDRGGRPRPADHRRGDRRRPGQQPRRDRRRPDDRALPRRLRDRRLPRHRRRRRLPARLRPPGPARRRRVDHLGEPRREPVADHHRTGGAGDGAVAEPGRGRPAAAARRALRAGPAGAARSARSCRTTPRAPCGCPSSRCATGRRPAPRRPNGCAQSDTPVRTSWEALARARS